MNRYNNKTGVNMQFYQNNHKLNTWKSEYL